MKPAILVTGGAGYIGSHTVVELSKAGYAPVILDNFCNSQRAVLPRLNDLCGYEIPCIDADVCDVTAVRDVLVKHNIRAVIHFAALKVMGESVRQPLLYLRKNLDGLLSVLEACQTLGLKDIVFSSTAAVYGHPHTVPIQEDFPLQAHNPYARSKLVGEQILHDLLRAEPDWRIGILRYFNPVGAHESGLIGESPQDIPTNIMPYICQVAVGQQPELAVFGGDYPTPDGSGVRDYIHVVDLARGHVVALDYLLKQQGQSFTVNLGTGHGISVLELVNAFQRVTGQSVPYRTVPRREGDVGTCWADAGAAFQLLGWKTEKDIDDMCRDAWRWQSQHPNGFNS
jgi:UDP-glucose 4-epimerase